MRRTLPQEIATKSAARSRRRVWWPSRIQSATQATQRLNTPESATPRTPIRGQPKSPKSVTQLPATLSMFWPRVTSMASRVWPWARSTAAIEMFIDSMNSVPPISVRKGRA